MPALYRAATSLVFPSTKEGFGLVVLEAMASGVPVVTSRIAPFTEYLGDDDVLWCDPFDTASIAAAMARSLRRFAPRTVDRNAACSRGATRLDEHCAMPILRPTQALREPFMPEMRFPHPLAGWQRRDLLFALARGEGLFLVGANYPLADFVERSRTALDIASERVKAKYGFPCSRAYGSARPDRERRRDLRRIFLTRGSRSMPSRNDGSQSMSQDRSRRAPLRRRDRRRSGRPLDQLVPGAQRHRPRRVREGTRRTRLARRAVGHILSGDAELAVPASGLPLSRVRPARLHAAGRDRRLSRRLRRLVRSAAAWKA